MGSLLVPDQDQNNEHSPKHQKRRSDGDQALGVHPIVIKQIYRPDTELGCQLDETL